MRLSAPRALASAAILATLLDAGSANAFLVARKGKPSSETQAVLARDGSTSVLTVAVKGGGAASLIVPIPKGAKPFVFEVDASALSSLESITSARVEQQWEQDPCELPMDAPPPMPEETPSGKDGAEKKGGEKKGADKKPAAPESRKAAALSDLGATQAEAVAALKKLGLEVDAPLEKAIGKALGDGYSLAALEMSEANGGRAAAIGWSSESFELPTQLISGAGRSALDLTLLTRGSRVGVLGTPNFGVPTNLDVEPAVLGSAAEFHHQLLSKLGQEQPQAAFVQYAWGATACDSCSKPLGPAELGALGVSAWPSASGAGELVILADAVSEEPGGPDDLRTALEACAATTSGAQARPAASLKLAVLVENGKTKLDKPALESPYEQCVGKAVEASSLDKSGTLEVRWTPLSRKFAGELVLTRVRVPGSDAGKLVFASGTAIEGGREIGPQGKPEQKVFEGVATNNFQTRYVVRHPWKGAIKCQVPQRGNYGGAPKNWKDPAAKKLAANADLQKLIAGGLPKLEAFKLAETKPAAVPPPAPAPSPSASASAPAASASAAPSSSNPPAADGCGCAIPSSQSGVAPGAFALGALLAAWFKRRLRRAQG
jgi:hypothetical protein